MFVGIGVLVAVGVGVSLGSGELLAMGIDVLVAIGGSGVDVAGSDVGVADVTVSSLISLVFVGSLHPERNNAANTMPTDSPIFMWKVISDSVFAPCNPAGCS